MANRRMFSKTITSSSQFLMMPPTSRLLYYDLGMGADDDGFAEHFTIMKMTDASPDDLRVLSIRGFIKVFDDKVLIILDWKENNYLRNDRYTPSKYLEIYKEELKQISSGIPNGDQMATQVRLGKVRLGKERENIFPPQSSFKEIKPLKEEELPKGEEITPYRQAIDYFTKDGAKDKVLEELILKGYKKDFLLLEMNKFNLYWTELNGTGKKQKWELQKTFEVKKRLIYWLNKNFK